MKKEEITRKFDEIVAFSEIEKFLDTPVKRYSSGMYIRLAFAVAAHLEPEVLIVDEVLAVGDAGFQRKCLGKMEGVAREGRTVLFVSHNMVAVEHLCNKALMLNAGKVVFTGGPKEAASYYLSSFSGNNGAGESSVVDLREAPGRPKKFRPHVQRLELFGEDGKSVSGGVKIGSPLRACIYFQLEKPAPEVHVQLSFDNDLGQRIFVASTNLQAGWQDVRKSGEHKFICDMPSIMLVPGGYRIKVLLDVNGILVDCVWDAARLTVLDSNYFGTGRWVPDHGFLVMKQEWRRE
jgi:lipopolysaccharide transport system ATP-binding protein